MPKPAPKSGKKPRWTTAQKASRAAAKKAAKSGKSGASAAPRKPHHRGQPEGANPPRRSERGGSEARPFRRDEESRPARRSQDRRFERRDDRREDRRDDNRRDDNRRDDRRFERRDERREDARRAPRSFRGDEQSRRAGRSEERRFERRDDRREDRRFERRDDRRRDGERPRWEDRRDERRPRRTDERPFRRDAGDGPRRERREPRVADPVRRDRHEGRHAGSGFHDAEAERAAADSWTKYESKGSGPAVVTEDNGFAALGLPERLVERLARDGITEPFPIQAATIPDALAGRDVLGRGQTGSGKTLAFGLPAITRLLDGVPPASKRPRALVLVPTRELAMQVSDALEPLVHVSGLRHKLVAGGLSYDPQIRALAKGVDILIATPGRLADLMERGAVDLGDVSIAILDEADHMADMGFLPEVTAILDTVPEGGQRLLFSATLDNGIDTLVERYLVDPVTHSTDEAQASVTTMSHHVLLIDPRDKKALTAELTNRSGRTVVFVRTQLGADRVARELRERGVLAAPLHGGLSQSVRNRALGAFRSGTLPVLVATDVAARGIHVDDIGLVLQVDPPRDHKDYLHRAGRTARAGEKGAVVTISLPHQRRMMDRLLEAAGAEADVVRGRPGDQAIRDLGGAEPTGIPVPDEVWRPILEGGPSRTGRRPGGPRRRAAEGDRRGRDPRRGEGRGAGRPRRTAAQWSGDA
jgi:superfamily II DNA/RNA helicase